MTTFQRMTELPEEQERALLAVPMPILLRKCNVLGATDKYLLINMLIATLTPNQLKAFSESRWSEADVAAAQAAIASKMDPSLRPQRGKEKPTRPTREPQAPKDPGAAPAPRTGRLGDKAIIHATAGHTKIQAGSLRAKLLDALELAEGRRRTVDQLTLVLGQDARPVIAKLRAAGWCEVVE